MYSMHVCVKLGKLEKCVSLKSENISWRRNFTNNLRYLISRLLLLFFCILSVCYAKLLFVRYFKTTFNKE